MKHKQVNTNLLVEYPDNPRTIDVYKFESLKKSIQEFPEMLKVRPILIDEDNQILSGNMRHKACKDLNIDKVYVTVCEGLTDDQKRELVIKDNLNYGEWDNDVLDFNFDTSKVEEWLGQPVVDYSDLDYEAITLQAEAMQEGVKKAIQLKIPLEEYESIKALEKECREKRLYIGSEFIKQMRQYKLQQDESNTTKGS